MATIRLEPHHGELRGLVLILELDGGAVEVIQADTRRRMLSAGAVVKVHVTPVFADVANRHELEAGRA